MTDCTLLICDSGLTKLNINFSDTTRLLLLMMTLAHLVTLSTALLVDTWTDSISQVVLE